MRAAAVAFGIARVALGAPRIEVTGCPNAEGEWVRGRELPAVSADGARVAALYPPSDGLRGNPGWTLAVIDVAGDRAVREEVLLSTNENGQLPCAALSARVARANGLLDRTRWVPLRALGALAGATPLGALDLAAEPDGTLRIRDGARVVFEKKVPGWTGGWTRCEGGKRRCDGEQIVAACGWAPGPGSLGGLWLDAARGVLLVELTPAAPGGGDSCEASLQLDALRLPRRVVAASGLAGPRPRARAAPAAPQPAIAITGCPSPEDPRDLARWLEVRGLPAVATDGSRVVALLPYAEGLALTFVEQPTAPGAAPVREPLYALGERPPCDTLRARADQVRARLAALHLRPLRELPSFERAPSPLGALDLRVTDEAALELTGPGRRTILTTPQVASIERLYYDAATAVLAIVDGDRLHAVRLRAADAAATGLASP